jgi:hypothetical protein
MSGGLLTGNRLSRLTAPIRERWAGRLWIDERFPRGQARA